MQLTNGKVAQWNCDLQHLLKEGVGTKRNIKKTKRSKISPGLILSINGPPLV